MARRAQFRHLALPTRVAAGVAETPAAQAFMRGARDPREQLQRMVVVAVLADCHPKQHPRGPVYRVIVVAAGTSWFVECFPRDG